MTKLPAAVTEPFDVGPGSTTSTSLPQSSLLAQRSLPHASWLLTAFPTVLELELGFVVSL